MLKSSEIHFHPNSMVNQQNCRSCALENPTEPQERPLHSPKITVWSTFEKVIVIGPYFFEDHNENAVTVNSECYIEMWNNFFVLELGLKSNSIGHVWFQQDGATASTARSSFFTLYWWLPHSQVCWHSLPPPHLGFVYADYFFYRHLCMSISPVH